PREFTPHYELALAWHAAGNDQQALSEAGIAIEIDPGSLDGRLARADILASLGRLDEAVTELRGVAARAPTLAGVHRRLASIHVKTGRLDLALNQLEKELAANPDDVDTLTDLGVLLFQADKIPEAATRLERAAELDPHKARA